MLAVKENILKSYLKYKISNNNDFDRELISSFFQYYKPFKVALYQLINLGYSERTALNLYQEQDIFNGLSSSIGIFTDENELIQNTLYKVMLTTQNDNFPYINILNTQTDINFTATYYASEDRTKVKEHIKALLLNTDEITIVDKFLSAKKRGRGGHIISDEYWEANLELLKYILPDKDITINIFCQNDWNDSRKNDLETYNSRWNIVKNEFDFNIHDRYIKTDKVEIILSSGFLNLSNDSKDFTYIVKVQNETR